MLKVESSKNLIDRFGLDETLPVNLDGLLEYYNISVYPTDFNELREFPEIANEEKEKGEILGAVAVQNNDIRILYKESDTKHRQKFTIAHELAHCCLDADSLMENGHIEYRKEFSERTGDNKEIKANIFAGELLIPETALNKIYAKVDRPNLEVLAKAFDVSDNVMRERLKKLGLQYSENSVLNYGYLFT